jgi:transcriptional regulator with XRE-family HTH domain
MENIREIVKELRELGLTQVEIGAALKLSQAYISSIERGKRGMRTPADTLCRAIKVRDDLRLALKHN